MKNKGFIQIAGLILLGLLSLGIISSGTYLNSQQNLVGAGSGTITTLPIKTFLGLTDTPNTYVGQASKVVSVKGDETGLEFTTGGGGFTNLTDFDTQTAWRVFYSDGSGDVTELALGASGTFLESQGASSVPTWSTPAGSGDVTKVGTPVDNQIGVWTGDGTIEGTAELTWSASQLLVREDDATNNGTTLVQKLSHTTSGTGGSSLGVGTQYEGENVEGTNSILGTTEMIIGGGEASENASFIVKLNAASSVAERFRVLSTGFGRFSGMTASELVATNASKDLVSLAVATYPSLAEIALIKGLTATSTELNLLDGITVLSGSNTGDQTITLTGDVTGTGTGTFAASIGNDKITEAMLKAVDASADEECLTKEDTTGDFEWQTCGGGGAPTDADYLVGTSNGSLSAEIVVGTSPGGELGNTWASPTIDDGLSVSSWTLTSPRIAGSSWIADIAGDQVFVFSAAGHAGTVNWFGVDNGATTVNPSFTALGETNVGIDLFPKGTGFIQVRGNSTQAGTLALYEDTDAGSNNATFKVPALTADTDYVLPADDGDATEQLTTDGSGNLTWEAAGSGSGAPTDADYLVGTTNGGLSAEIVVGTSPGGELGGTWGSPTLDDSVTTTGWVMGTFSGTTLTAGTVNIDLLDGVGAVDMDYGSADITDHTFITDGTGTAEIVLPDGSIGSLEILDGDLLPADLDVDADVPGDEECLSYEATGTDFEWQSCGGTPTVITVADTTDSTSFVGLFESATGDLGPKTDGGLLYDASNGTLSSTLGTFTKLGVGDPVDASRILLVEGDVSGGIATFERTNASTNAAVGTTIIKGTSTGDMVDGFGSAFQFAIEDTANTENLIANIQGVRDGADNSGALLFATYNAGTPAVGLEVDSSQNVYAYTNLLPDINDGAVLGSTSLGWADLHLATGGTLNIANGNWLATHSFGILTVGTGDLRVTTAGTNTASVVTVGGTQTLTAKTLTDVIIAGTPNATGELGRDTTQQSLDYYDNGQLGTIPKVINVGTGTQTLTNSVATDQDFTSLYTLPANSIFTNKNYRVTVIMETVTGTSSVTITAYLKLGATKVYNSMSVPNLPDGQTRTRAFTFLISGRAAAGAAADVTTSAVSANWTDFANTVNQPVALATNGTLAITPGVTYSGTGSTETVELQSWFIEEIN